MLGACFFFFDVVFVGIVFNLAVVFVGVVFNVVVFNVVDVVF